MSQPSFQPTADDQPTASPTTAQTAVMDSPEFTVGSPFSHTDRLMDDLFVDLEQALARETLLSVAPELEEAPSPPTEPPSFAIAAPTATGALMPRLTPRQLVPGEVEPDADVVLAVNESAQPGRKSRSLDMLLLSTLCASLLTTGILWLWFRHRAVQVPAPAPVAEAPQPTAEQIKAEQHQEFLNYVDRSLDRIEQAAKEQRQQNQSEPEKPAPAPSQTVLERVYVPVYQPPQVIAAQPNVVIQQPNLPPSTTVLTAPAPAANVPNIATNSSYKLVGVLELGDRSAALFDINGSPRRIQVGEPIGDSGWTLVSVSNQEAIVRRNGEVRSVYVGQAF